MEEVTLKKIVRVVLISLHVAFAVLTALLAVAPYADPRSYLLLYLLCLIFPGIVGASLILAIYWGIRKRWIMMTIFLVAIAANWWNIRLLYQLPFGRNGINVADAKPPQTLRVVTYNVADFKYNAAQNPKLRIAQYLFRLEADIVCLQEYKEGVNAGDTIIGNFGYLPYKTALGKAPGRLVTAIFSKYPILNNGELTYDNSNNTGVFCDLDINGRTVRVFSVHFQTTNLNQMRHMRDVMFDDADGSDKQSSQILSLIRQNAGVRVDQAEVIRSVIDTTRYPIILCCDMNAPPNTFIYRTVKGKNLKDGFVTNGRNYGSSFNGFYGLRIDYIFYSDAFKGKAYESPSLTMSDHNPVIMDFSFSGL